MPAAPDAFLRSPVRSPARSIPTPPALSTRPARTLLLLGCGLLGGALPGCGKKTTLSVKVYSPSGAADPFSSATRVRMTLGDKLSEADVAGGKFEVSIELDDPSSTEFRRLLIEAFDASGTLVGRGRTPDFVVTADNYQVAVLVGRTGQVSATELYLPDDLAAGATTPPLPAPLGRALVSATALRGRQVSPAEPGYGALIAGGYAEGGRHPAGGWLYQALTHQLIDAGTLLAPRHGAVLLPSADTTAGQDALLVGGVGPNGMPVTAAEKFSPRVSAKSQLFAAPGGDVAELAKPGQFQPAVAELALPGGAATDTVFLIAGGSEDSAGMTPSAQAATARRWPAPEGASDTSARPGVRPLAAPMLAPRWRHTASPASTTTALVFGGLTPTDEKGGKPVAERFSIEKNVFEELKLNPAVPSRRGHVALKLKSGRILIAGGYTDDGMGKREVQRSALLINPTDGSVESRPMQLTTPRYAAALAEVDGDVLICGGYDPSDAPLADCELLKNEALGDVLEMAAKVVPLPRARAEHVMVTLENGLVLLIGGIGEGKRPVAAIDFYIPR